MTHPASMILMKNMAVRLRAIKNAFASQVSFEIHTQVIGHLETVF